MLRYICIFKSRENMRDDLGKFEILVIEIQV
jgi:hypothetical protein